MDHFRFGIVCKLGVIHTAVASSYLIFYQIRIFKQNILFPFLKPKLALLTLFFVTLCRSFDDKNDLENDGDNNEKLNEWNDTDGVQRDNTAEMVRFYNLYSFDT